MNYDSDSTPMYVVLVVIPVIFIMIAIHSRWRDSIRIRRDYHHESAR